MKIAIHKNKDSFAEYWIQYCINNKIDYKIIDCYKNTIIKDIEDCDGLIWHPLQGDFKSEKFFKQLMFSIEQSGKKVFPDFRTLWHFDDKVGQKYLLEAIDAPIIPSYVFFSKKEALNWAGKTNFPKVFKLRGGGGYANVKLAKTKRSAINLINLSFGKGHPPYNKFRNFKERIRKYRIGKTNLHDVFKGFIRIFYKTEFERIMGNDKGYVYFQDFIPNNTFDLRVIVIGTKAFAIKRLCRPDDFRASGSGIIIYDKDQIDERCVKIAFEVNKKLKSQSIAYDFIFDSENTPLIIEISFGFAPAAYEKCVGYWDKDLNWFSGSFNPYGWIIKNLISDEK